MPFLERLQSAMILKTPMFHHNEAHIVEHLHAPFYEAIRQGALEQIIQMIDEGFDVDFHEAAHIPPLIYSILRQQYRIAEYLLEQGAHVNITSFQGDTPLHIAMKLRLPETVYLLLRYGADPDRKDADGNTAATLANNDDTLLGLLHETQAMPHSGCSCFESAKNGNLYELSLTCNADAALFETTEQGHTLLHLAIYSGNKALVRYLLNKGLDIDAVDNSGNTPLGIAVKFEKNLDIVSLLIDRKATLDHRNAQSRTPLTSALRNGHTDIAMRLIQSGANIHVVDALHTPLTLVHEGIEKYPARANAMRQLETELMIHGAHVDIPINNLRWTPLYFTISKLQNHAMQEHLNLLIQLGADLNYRDTNGRSPLMIAASLGRYNAVETLVNNYVKLDLIDTFGWSALMLGVYYNHYKIVQFLLESGANANLVSTTQLSALKIAKEHQRDHIVTLLLDYGAKEEKERE